MSLLQRHFHSDLDAALRTRLDRERGSEHERSFPHAAESAARRAAAVHSAAVVEDAKDDTSWAAGKFELDMAGLRVSGDVGQALLSHAVERKLNRWFKAGKIAVEPSLDFETASLGERSCERRQGTDEPEVLKGFGSQLSCDPTHFVQTRPDGLLGFDKLFVKRRRCLISDAFELEEDAGHGLPDLVVEAPCDPQTLGLLCREGPLAALTALTLQPIEHLVEGVHELPDFFWPRGGKPLSRTEKIDVLHAAGEPLERCEAGPEKNEIGDDQRNQP